MGVVRKIIRPILQYFGGLIFAYGLGIWCVWGICYLLFVHQKILDMHGDGVAYIMYHSFFFFGIPFGGPLGMLFVDKLFFEPSTKKYIHRIVAGSLFGVVGSAFVYWVLPLLGIAVFDGFLPPMWGIDIVGGAEIFLFLSVFFALIGYNAAGLFKRDRKNPCVN